MNEHKFELVQKEWSNFINNREVNTSVVSPIIYASWERSKKYGVNPYTPLEKIIPTDESLEDLTRYEDLLPEYGEIINIISEIAEKTGLICRVANKDARILKIIANADIVKSNFKMGNYFSTIASESFLGTNALILSIKENKPIQILGPEHYNYYFHRINCSSAPIHNEKGEVIGCVNISTNSSEKVSMQTLGLAISIAEVLDNHLFINKMLEEQIIKNTMLEKIMENVPSGIIYFDERGMVKNYNNNILKLFGVREKDDEDSKVRSLSKYIGSLGCLKEDNEVSNKEYLLKIGGKTESFLVSKKNIHSPDKEQKGNIILVENTDSVLKLHDSLRANNAIYTFDHIVGESPNLQCAKRLSQKVARSSSSVIIYGESGTGKELFAQAIHNASFRKDKPFIGINCGAIPSELIESEIFGYEPGAFTGALKGGKPGKLEIASGGTLFLDEIESMPLSLQIKLLRALSLNRISKVGSTKEIPVDIRLISATKKDLLKEVERGNFREDLYYRINVVTIDLPPLREREIDIPTLANHFIGFFPSLGNIEIDPPFYDALMLYSWRGNIRELRNVIERAILFWETGEKLTIEHLPEHIKDNYLFNKIKDDFVKQREALGNTEEKGLLEIAEELAIETALKEEKYNISKTAKKLKISRSTLYQKVKKSKRLSKIMKEVS